VFVRNLYDTDETNSTLEIMLELYCPIFEEIKPFSFYCFCFFLNLPVSAILIFM